MFIKLKKSFLLLVICLLYGLISLLSAFSAINKYKRDNFQRWNPVNFTKDSNSKLSIFSENYYLEIWDTSGVGLYLWKHILEGQVSNKAIYDGWFGGFQSFNGLDIKYKLKYGLLPWQGTLIPSENVFLVLNGRNSEAVKHAQLWLDYLISYKSVYNLGLLLLGDESCNNNWLKQYLQHKKLRVVFHIYNSDLIDDKRVFGWPLGVASNKSFPLIELKDVHRLVHNYRLHLCTFAGTFYPNSSRERLKNVLKHYSSCSVDWKNKSDKRETIENALRYQRLLINSDYALSPVGKNAECHRTYEAIEMGSIPIIEDVPTPTCNYSDQILSSPYKLLKEYEAPVLYVKNWEKELPAILDKLWSDYDATRKRVKLLEWNADFKRKMRSRFVTNILILFKWKSH